MRNMYYRKERKMTMNPNYYEESKFRGKELARAYVPFQYMSQIYSAEEALINGTLFPELNKPYEYYRGY